MKPYCLLFFGLLLVGLNDLAAQARDPIPDSLLVVPTKRVITVGLLQGGSIIGADVEFRMIDGMGFQVGAGLLGFSSAINFHFRPDIRSSCISMVYIHQGFGDLHYASLFGPSYIQRWQNGFSLQLGIGFLSEFGPLSKEIFRDEVPGVQPFMALGYYF